MKNILIYLPALFLLFGCEDFLNRAAYDQMDSENFYRNAEEINAAVMACYNGIHGTLNNEFFLTEVRSDNTRHEGQGSTTGTSLEIANLDLFKVEPSNTINNAYWEKAYHNIANCNTVLGHSQVVTNVTLREQYDAEARFIRAYHYFNLVRLYGPLFLVTERITAEEAKNYERSTVDAVYRLIIDDLDYASRKLPVKYDSSNIGRVDQWGAKTLLGKVYLTLSKNGMDKEMLTQAKLLLEDVEKNSGYGLVTSSYADVFSISNEMNKEIIFAVRYLSGNAGIGSPFGNMFAPVNNGANVIIGTSSGYNTPTDNIIAAYEQRGAGADKRLDVNIAQKYFNTTTQTWVTEGNCRYCKKYVNPVTTQYDGESDWPVIRVADIALLYAELTNEISGPSADNLKYLNMVCERAGVSTYTLTDLPSLYDFRKAVRNERRLELAFENQRWFDLLRWGIATQTVNNYLNSELLYTEYSYTVNDIEDWQTFLPIPVSVIDINPEIAQNTGY